MHLKPTKLLNTIKPYGELFTAIVVNKPLLPFEFVSIFSVFNISDFIFNRLIPRKLHG